MANLIKIIIILIKYKNMLEKEVKILEINKHEVINNIKKLWAKKIFQWYIYDIYYDFFDKKKNCFKLKDNKRIFRIRKMWNDYFYTIKRKRKQKWLKIADEHEAKISNIQSFKKILKGYWMIQTRKKEKYRTSYIFKNVHFDIDEYKKIPVFMEIEAWNLNEINFFIKELWLKNHKIKTFWSEWLFKFYWL